MSQEDSKFLETEEAIQSLLIQLKQLKTAAEQIEQAKSKAEAVVGAADEVVIGFKTVATMVERVLTQISDTELPNKLTSLIDTNQTLIQTVTQHDESNRKRIKVLTWVVIGCVAAQTLTLFVIILGIIFR